MTVDDVALGHEVLPPNAVEDVLPRDDPSGAACQEVEQALLNAAQVDHGLTDADLAIDDVDLDVAERYRRHDRPIATRRPTGDGDRSGEEFLG